MSRTSYANRPHLANMTKTTRDMMAGKTPSRDMKNYKAIGKAARKREWEKRNGVK